MEALFIYCIVWSLGSVLVQQPEAPDRDRFDLFLKTLSGLGTVDGERVSAMQLPIRSLYEYCFDVSEGCWKAWKTYVHDYTPPLDGQFSKILVPTVDVVRCAWVWCPVIDCTTEVYIPYIIYSYLCVVKLMECNVECTF
jgi:dynein heavy chain, axonemal